MAIKKIYYEIKRTSASTDYLIIDANDKLWLLEQLFKMQSYLNECQLTKDRDAKEVLGYFNKKTKTLPYNNIMKCQNTPLSFISGLCNNLMFGTQDNISLTQSQHLENIISTFVTFVNAIEGDLNIRLQKNTSYDSVLFVENFFVSE